MSNYSINERAQMFHALSNPHRLGLFHRLTTCCAPGTECSTTEASQFCVGELGEGMDIAPSTLSHHLKELHRAGLIEMQRRGKNVVCWVVPETLSELAIFFTSGFSPK